MSYALYRTPDVMAVTKWRMPDVMAITKWSISGFGAAMQTACQQRGAVRASPSQVLDCPV